MNGILYYLAYGPLWVITLLPLPVLYLISDFFFILVYYVFRYRRKTVFNNLRRSFPEKTDGEIRKIARKFYHQLNDYFIEWMYSIHMGEKEQTRRLQYINPEIFETYLQQGKSIMLYFSHYGNWEWTNLLPRFSGYTTLAIYKPLENKYFDRLFLNLRGKFGVVGVPMASTLRKILEYRNSGTPILLYNLADQRPEWKSIQHWTRFLNQDTPVITGAEKIARRFDMVTIQIIINRVKRGYYEAKFQVLCEDPGKADEFEITRKYLGILEKSITEKPELYLWTHKRWKYSQQDSKDPIDIGPLISDMDPQISDNGHLSSDIVPPPS